MPTFPNDVQAISYSTNLQTQNKGDKFFYAKSIYYDGSGLTEQNAFGKFCSEMTDYIDIGFEVEFGKPKSGFNFFPEFSVSRKSGSDVHFFGIIYIWYNTVTKIYTT